MAQQYVIYQSLFTEGKEVTVEIGRYPDNYIMNPLQNGALAVQELIKPGTKDTPPQMKMKALYANGVWESVKLEGSTLKTV